MTDFFARFLRVLLPSCEIIFSILVRGAFHETLFSQFPLSISKTVGDLCGAQFAGALHAAVAGEFAVREHEPHPILAVRWQRFGDLDRISTVGFDSADVVPRPVFTRKFFAVIGDYRNQRFLITLNSA